MRICTIVARNYLAYARVLATSFREQHPAGECFVLVIDDVAGEVDDSTEPFRIVRPSDLPLQRFEAMAAMYDVTELATAVKPWLLEHLLAEGGEAPISYFDPDIRFYAPVEEIAQQAIDHELVLIPHITAPLPDDGQQPGELDAHGLRNIQPRLRRDGAERTCSRAARVVAAASALRLRRSTTRLATSSTSVGSISSPTRSTVRPCFATQA